MSIRLLSFLLPGLQAFQPGLGKQVLLGIYFSWCRLKNRIRLSGFGPSRAEPHFICPDVL